MGKGSTTTTSDASSTVAPTTQASSAYSDVLNRAQDVASTPYQAYTGELTAGVNSQQNLGISNINANANYAQPYIQQAASQAQSSSAPITAQGIQYYQNPYTQQVVNATQAQINQNNEQQQAQLKGNTISSGALGGNREGVAQANLAGQQSIANNSTIAGLYSDSYKQALAAAQSQQGVGLTGANAIANYGIQGQNAALTGANQQLNAGTLQQTTQQAADTANYGQYTQAQAYPYQQTSWLSGLDTSIGGAMGSTSTGTNTTTKPETNQTAQYLGAGLTAASLFARGGRVHHNGIWLPFHAMASGGVASSPWADAQGWIPQTSGKGSGIGMAHANATDISGGQQQAGQNVDYSKLISSNSKDSNGLFSGDSYGGGNVFTSEYGGSSSNPLEGLTAADYGAGYASGGVVPRRGYEGGGAPDIDYSDPAWSDSRYNAGVVPSLTFADRAEPTERAVASGEFDPRGENNIDQKGGALDFKPTQAVADASNGVVPTPKARPEGAEAPVVASDEETDDEAPAPKTRSVVPPQGVAGAEQSQSLAPTAPQQPQVPQRNSNGIFGTNVFGLSPNARSGLLAAGLGMLASRSPNFGVAVGQGGLQGVAAYSAGEQNDRKVEQEALKLAAEARKSAEEMAFKKTQQAETVRHNQATEENAASTKSKFVPAGSIITEKGVHPAILDQSSGKVIDAITGKPPKDTDSVTPKGSKAPINDDDAKALADYYVKTGDNSRLNGLGISGEAKQRVQHFVTEAMGRDKVTPEELATRTAEFAGRKAGQRVLATQEAKMGSAAYEAEGAIKLTRGLIEKLPRTSFLPLNQLIQGYQNKTLNPDQAELYARSQAIVNTYSAVMARGANVTTDASRHKAESLLNTAYDPATFNRVLDTLQNEIDMAKHSPAKMREFYRQQYGAKAIAPEDGSSATAPATTAPPIGGFTPPTGAIPRQYNDKTYYYDPQTKQPYPGQ